MDSFERISVPDNILDRLEALEAKVAALLSRDTTALALDEISDDLGVIRAGQFIAGEGDPNDSLGAFTGVVMSGEQVTGSDGNLYNLLGANAGVVQFGLNALTGQALAGAGAVKLDETGISIAEGNADVNSIRWLSGSTIASIYADLIAGLPTGENLLAITANSPTGYVGKIGLYAANIVVGTVGANITILGPLVINSTGGDYDTQVKGITDANTLYVDASTDRVGIGTATPGSKLDVNGAAQINQLVVNEAGADLDTRIEGDTDANLFYTDAGNGRVGIGTAAPTEKLDVVGNLFLNSGSVRSFTASLADDTATSFTPGKSAGAILVFTTGGSNDYVQAAFVTATPNMTAGPISANSAVTTGVLSGTTGTDTKLTVSCHTDGKIYLENRRGATRAVYVLII